MIAGVVAGVVGLSTVAGAQGSWWPESPYDGSIHYSPTYKLNWKRAKPRTNTSPNGKIVGKVTCDGQRLEGVRVYVAGHPINTVTGSNGKYQLYWLQNGHYDVVVEPDANLFLMMFYSDGELGFDPTMIPRIITDVPVSQTSPTVMDIDMCAEFLVE